MRILNFLLFISILLGFVFQVQAQDYGIKTYEDIDTLSSFPSILNIENGDNKLLMIGRNRLANAQNLGINIKFFNSDLDITYSTTIFDSLGFLSLNPNCSYLINDHELVILGTRTINDTLNQVWYSNVVFLKYNIDTKEIISHINFDTGYDDFIYGSTYNSDGHFYLNTRRSEPLLDDGNHWGVIKVDTTGNLIWDKLIEKNTYDNVENHLNSLASYEGGLIGVGAHSFEFVDYTAHNAWEIFTMDSSGTILDSIIFNNIGVFSQVRFFQDKIYTIGARDSLGYYSPFIMCLDMNLNVLWEDAFYNLDYSCNYRDLKIIDDRIYVTAHIEAYDNFFNSRRWAYFSSWELDGTQNWERLFVADTNYTAHHIEDLVITPTEDIIIAGWVINGVGNAYNFVDSDFILIRTDIDGCSVYDECHATIEEHLLVSSVEEEITLVPPAEIDMYYDPLSQNLSLKHKNREAADYTVRLSSLDGRILSMNDFFDHNYAQDLSTLDGQLYVIQVYKNGVLYWSDKLVKY